MARRYEWEDSKDRSINKPHVTVEREAIIDLYNQAHGENSAHNLSESVKNWFEAEAKIKGWSSVQFVDQIAVLGFDFSKQLSV